MLAVCKGLVSTGASAEVTFLFGIKITLTKGNIISKCTKVTYFLSEHMNMIRPRLVGGAIPGQEVTAYWVAVSWARQRTAYCNPWRQGFM